ncbi:uncharacterized protein LOC115230721 [Octopus sinensis]|uniref:Uncharacterized protein LOC115230721 n=1 Tax=Octopus sinensis TaxID=2607531 RepID=A0A6P7TY71_9MOLL|nr:uncharacterized protein LOC115230721 [Octopus sinensis]
MCRHHKIKAADKWYKHHPEAVTEGGNITILWDFPLCTDQTIKANKPYIVVNDKSNEVCSLIDMSMKCAHNISTIEFDKLRKYRDLLTEIEKMWHLKTFITPLIVGAHGMIKKGTENYLRLIRELPSMQEVQKIA